MQVLQKKAINAMHISKKIAELAKMALLEEVYTTPKPGLVDLMSNGAHKDMTIKTFLISTETITPYFEEMARIAITKDTSPDMIFKEIREVGIEAEHAMFRATGNINTHKGLIFSLGILSAAAGISINRHHTISLHHIRSIEQEMVCDILLKEIDMIYVNGGTSHGEKNLLKYGSSGIRGEALAGYPSIINISLPAMSSGLWQGHSWNAVKLQSLLSLMAKVEDSNVLARHNKQVLGYVQTCSHQFLNEGGAYGKNSITKLQRMDHDFTAKNISSGGCADLLAVTIFFQLIMEKRYGIL